MYHTWMLWEMKPSIVEAGKGHRHFLRKLPAQRFLIHRWLQRIQNLEITFLNVPSLKTKVWHGMMMGTQWALNKAGYFWGGLSYRDPDHEQTIFSVFFFKKWKSTFVTDDLVKLHASLSHKALSRHRLTSRSMCMKPCVTICFRLPLVSKSPHNNCAGKSRAWISLVHRHSFYLFSIFLRS